MQTPSLDNDAVLWSEAAGEKPLIVLLHGYGADERDLFSLRDHLPSEFAYAAVRAPLEPPFPMSGYSWYPIDDLSSRDPVLVSDAATRLLEWLDGAGVANVGLVGFSQGGAVALQALRLAPERVDFVVNLSGYAAGGSLPGDEVLSLSRPPVFWGRGTDDQVIPEAAVVQTTDWLPAHASLVGRVYPGLAHAVSAQEIADVAAFLERQAPQQR